MTQEDINKKIFTEEELIKHDKAVEDYPDAMPTYETIKRYISNIRALLEEVKKLREGIEYSVELMGRVPITDGRTAMAYRNLTDILAEYEVKE